jgi:predicted RNA-binding protein associated with RNAse of E/G family
MEQIKVLKRNLQGEVTWQYTGLVLERGADFVRLEARFNRADMPFMGVVLKQNDRFVETFYTARWYNIFEIHDRDDDQIKGWYCNLGRPAVWDAPDTISYVDLALDLWVAADGAQTVLDEDEFEALGLDEALAAQVLNALAELMETISPIGAQAPGNLIDKSIKRL